MDTYNQTHYGLLKALDAYGGWPAQRRPMKSDIEICTYCRDFDFETGRRFSRKQNKCSFAIYVLSYLKKEKK